jgi:hypothetical protein
VKRTFNAALAADWSFISESDPALDRTAPGHDYERYLETHDEAHLRFVGGATPARFALRFPTRAERRKLVGLPYGELLDAATALCVRSISGYESDGVEVHAQHGPDGLTDGTLEAIGDQLTREIGRAIVQTISASEKFS